MKKRDERKIEKKIILRLPSIFGRNRGSNLEKKKKEEF